VVHRFLALGNEGTEGKKKIKTIIIIIIIITMQLGRLNEHEQKIRRT